MNDSRRRISPVLPLGLAGLAAALLLDSASAATKSTTPAPPSSAASATPLPVPPEATRQVAALLAEISPARLRATVDRLAGFGTRHTLSETESTTRGIGAARRWLHDELESYGAAGAPLEVRFDSHHQEPDGRRILRAVEIVNVIAELPGTLPAARARRYYVVGHYDSRASDPLDSTSDAPGANDDASGVALVVELARVFAAAPADSTLVFLATAGEEQGLLGARAHAKAAKAAGLDIRGVLSNDIVGDPSAPDGRVERTAVRVFSEGLPAGLTAEDAARLRSQGAESDSPSRQLARYVSEIAARQQTAVTPRLIFRPDRFLRGGDHLGFNENGFAAVRFTTVPETYTRQHQDVRDEDGVAYGDLPQHVDAEYLAGVARVNAAALAHLANAPSPPGAPRLIAAELRNDSELRWSESPEPDVAGYEVAWRDTTSAVWQHHRDVGRATSATLPVSKDDFAFGVRAYDRQGYRSPVAAAVPARE